MVRGGKFDHFKQSKKLRARFNFTQSVLAEKVGVTRQTIAAIEKGITFLRCYWHLRFVMCFS